MSSTSFVLKIQNYSEEAYVQASTWVQANLPQEHVPIFQNLLQNPQQFIETHRQTFINMGICAVSTSVLCYLVGMKVLASLAITLSVLPLLAIEDIVPAENVSFLCLKISSLVIAGSLLTLFSGTVPFYFSIYTTWKVCEHLKLIHTLVGPTKLNQTGNPSDSSSDRNVKPKE